MTTHHGTGRRRYWVWNPAFALRIVLGNLARVVSLFAFRVVEAAGGQWGLIALGVVGCAVVWFSWHGKKDHSVGEGGKVRMHGAVDRLGYWGSVLVTTAFVVGGGFMFPMTLLG